MAVALCGLHSLVAKAQIAKPVEQPGSSPWNSYRLNGLSIETPAILRRPSNPSEAVSLVPAESRNGVEMFEQLDSDPRYDRLRVAVSTIKFRADIEPNLEGAAAALMKYSKTATGDAAATVEIKPMKINGFEARNAEFRGHVPLGNFFASAIFVKQGQTMWTAYVLSSDSSKTDAERILRSIQIVPGEKRE